MPRVVEMRCAACSQVTYAPARNRPPSISRCGCGGWRQATRVISERRHLERPVSVERRRF